MMLNELENALEGVNKSILDYWLNNRQQIVEWNIRHAIKYEPNENIKFEGNLDFYKFKEYDRLSNSYFNFPIQIERKLIKRHKKRRLNKKLNKKYGYKFILKKAEGIKPYWEDSDIVRSFEAKEIKLEKIKIKHGDFENFCIIETGRTNVIEHDKSILYSRMYTQVLKDNEIIWEDRKKYV